jgi:hypothetical protein
LQKKVNELEKEVEELEHIINFFENNIDINEEEKQINEEDLEKLGIVKQKVETLLSMQYIILIEKYKNYCEQIKTVFNELIPVPVDSELGILAVLNFKIFKCFESLILINFDIYFKFSLDFSEFSKKMFGKFQDLLKGCLLMLNTSNNNKSINTKQINNKEFQNVRLEQLNLIENEFKDKAERIKVLR